jgi:hypothetical protein
MRIDSKSSQPNIEAWSIKNERERYDSVSSIDRVKYMVQEGSMLTFVGKITYDLQSDELCMSECFSVVGGGLREVSAALN